MRPRGSPSPRRRRTRRTSGPLTVGWEDDRHETARPDCAICYPRWDGLGARKIRLPGGQGAPYDKSRTEIAKHNRGSMRASHKIPNVKIFLVLRGPAQYPRFVLFGNFLENASDGGGARHTHTRASLPRTPTNLPSFPQSLADPNLNLPHRRLPPAPAHGTNANMAATRLSLNTASFAPSRVARPAGRCVPSKSQAPPDPAFDRVSSRVLAGPPRREREYASRRDERTPPNLTREIPPRRCVETRIFFALGADEAAPLSPTVAP